MAIDRPAPGYVPGRTPSLARQIAGCTPGKPPVWTTQSGQAPNVQSPTGTTSPSLPTGNMNGPTSVTGS